MKKIAFLAVTGLMMASCAHEEGKVTIQLPADYAENTIIVSHSTIDNMINAKQADDVIVLYDTLDIKDGVAVLTLDPAGSSRYNIEPPMLTRMQPEFYASPGDQLKVTIRAFDPLDYEVSGTELMNDVTAFAAATDPIQQEYVRLAADENMTPEQSKEIWDRYDAAVKKFVKDHPKSPALPLAILNLGGDDFKAIYDNMSPEAKKSILMPFAEEYNKEVMKMVGERAAEEARKAEVASGTITAPDFTLKDMNGKEVSLSDFKGKWVVLDFWGSWCGWCIKGFPALKDAYNKYGDKITVIGIDCNDSESDWREAVKKYELPWLQLYNGDDKEIYLAYKIEGFPTKAIINPEGKLVDLTTGEDPSFFTRLASFVK